MSITSNIPEQILLLAQNYSQSTEIPCAILDIDKKVLVDLHCDFCHHSGSEHEDCLSRHLLHAKLSVDFGGSYVYFCHDPILYWISPILQKGRMVFAIVAGPVLATEHSEIINECNNCGESFPDPRSNDLMTFVHVPIGKIHHLAEVLRMCAGWGSDSSGYRIEENKKILTQQSNLSTFIQQLKADGEDAGASSASYPLELEDKLQDAIRWGNKKDAQQIMNDLLGLIYFVEGNTYERIIYRIVDLIALLSRAAVKGGAPATEIREISFRCQQEIHRYTSIEGLSRWLSIVLHQYVDLVFFSSGEKYGSRISRAISYIRQHYAQRLTLEEVASSVSLSVSHFSRLFHRKTGIPFNTYVNRIRIESAQRLLDDSNLSIVEIAGAVGFEDQSYFSKVFHRMAGITPGRYREGGYEYPSDTHEIHKQEAFTIAHNIT